MNDFKWICRRCNEEIIQNLDYIPEDDEDINFGIIDKNTIVTYCPMCAREYVLLVKNGDGWIDKKLSNFFRK